MQTFSVKALLLGLAVSATMPLAGFAENADQTQDYVSGVFDKVKANWSEQAVEKRLSNADVTLLLNEDGTLSASHVESGPNAKLSGEEALEFVKKSAPFGAFPEAWKGSQAEFRFRFTPVSMQMVGYQVLENRQALRLDSPVTMAPGLVMMAISEPGRELGQARTNAQMEESLGMAAYVTDVQEKVKQKWQLPQDYVFQRVVADIMIDRDGSLLSAMLKQSSGDKTVDKAALKAIQDAAPFSRVPASAKSLPVQIEYIFDPVQSPTVE